MREQPDVRAAVAVLQRYGRYQSDNLETRTAPQPEGLLVLPELISARTRASRQMVEMTLAMCVQSFRGLLGETWSPSRIAFGHAAPADVGPYRAGLGPVQFRAPYTGFLLTHDELAIPLGHGDPQMAREIARFIEASATPQTERVSETVNALIQRLLPEGNCSVDLVAQHLGVDRRTVHRRLAAEGRSFSQLLEQTRREVASWQLNYGDRPLSEVAALVGFSSLSTFSRWFRQSFGMQPSEYRRQAQGG